MVYGCGVELWYSVILLILDPLVFESLFLLFGSLKLSNTALYCSSIYLLCLAEDGKGQVNSFAVLYPGPKILKLKAQRLTNQGV